MESTEIRGEATRTVVRERLHDAGDAVKRYSGQAVRALKKEPPWALAVMGGLFVALIGAVTTLFLQRRSPPPDLLV